MVGINKKVLFSSVNADVYQKNWKDLVISDVTGTKNDSLTFSISANNVAGQPTREEIIKVAFEYRGNYYRMGEYTITSIKKTYFPDKISIRAVTSPQEQSNRILKQKKTRTFQGTLDSVVKTIANENSLNYYVDDVFQQILIVDLIQREETDLEFLTKLVDRYKAMLKIDKGTLFIMQQAKDKKNNGTGKATVIANSNNILNSFTVHNDKNNQYNGVIVKYYSLIENKTFRLQFGESPFKVLESTYHNQDEAFRVGEEELKLIKLEADKVSMLMLGEPDIAAQNNIEVNYRDVNKTFMIHSVSHQVIGDLWKSRVTAVANKS